ERTAQDELESFTRILGRRLGELHLALARPSGNPDFDVIIASEADVARWRSDARSRMETALQLLEQVRHDLPGDAAVLAENLLARSDQVLARLERLAEDSM